jgi:hypothetical protein
VFFVELGKIIIKFIWKGKGTAKVKNYLKKKSKAGGIHLI